MLEPREPEQSECCNSGCNPCIFDVYEAQLKRFKFGSITITEQNCIDPIKYNAFTVTDIKTQGTGIFVFEFECSKPNNSQLIYNPGQHFLLKSYSDRDQCYFTRAYTPVNVTQTGCGFKIVTRVYKMGDMSRYLKNLKIGQETLWRGPYGDFKINFDYKNVILIAQGTGVAPLYSVLNRMLENEECYSTIKLFYCCQSISEVLLRDELYELSRYWNFSYELFLKECDSEEVKYNEVVQTRRLGKLRLGEYLNGKEDVRVLICGNTSFSEDFKRQVIECDVEENRIFTF